jgi:flagellar biosynthetic protein FliR
MDISQYLIGLILAFSRVASFLFFVPFLRNKAIPSIVKITISVAISLVAVGKMGKLPVETLPDMVIMILTQILIGITLAYVVEMIFTAATIAGGILDIDLGFSAAQVMDPMTNHPVTVMSNFFSVLFTIVFISVGGVNFLIAGIVHSFAFTTPLFFMGHLPFLEVLMGYFNYMLVSSIQIALPLMATMFIVNFILLILGKSAPQMNIFQNMFAIKIVVGIFFLYVTLPFLGEVFMEINDSLMDKYLEVMKYMFRS